MEIKYFLWLCIGLFLLVGCKKDKNKIKPEYKDLTEAVYASGNIFPKNEYQVYANADGLLSMSFVEAGDSVIAGQPLFKIDDGSLSFRREASNVVYKTAMENLSNSSPVLKEAKKQLDISKVKLQNDSVNFIRFKHLWSNNATSKIEYDKSLMNYNISKDDYEAKKNGYEKLKLQLFVELQNAESQYKSNSKEEQNYLVRAMIPGQVYEVYKDNGEAVRRNDPIALIGDNNKIYLKLAVDELDIEKVRPGQEVFVKVDLYKDKVFKAKISRVYRKMNTQDQSFRVDADFVNEQPKSFYGITVEANIIIQKKEKTLTIPKKYLAAPDSVWVETEEGEKKIKIKTGVEDFDYVEVLQGIDKDSKVINKQ